MKNKKFEKRRKGVETLFDVIFWFYLIETVGLILFKIFYVTGLASVDVFNTVQFTVLLVGLVSMFFSSHLAHKGHVAAGIIGIFVALTQFIFGGLLWKIVGALLAIDSIMYLVYYKK